MRSFLPRPSRILFAGLLFLLASCGFHLRGFGTLPGWLDNIAVVLKEANADLVPLIEKQLKAYGKCIVPPQSAKFVIILSCDNYMEQMTNVSASTAPRQYLLIYELKYTVLTAEGKPILSETEEYQSVSIRKQITINNDRILGSNAEEAMFKREMRKEAVIQLINQLNTRVIPAV